MKDGVFYATVVIALALFGLSMVPFLSGLSATAAVVAKDAARQQGQQNPHATQTGGVVVVQMGFDGSQYSPNEIKVKQGDRVRIEADAATLRGCMSTLTIPDYGIRKRIMPGDNVIEFTADRSGVFRISCPMGMGNGRLVVADASGNLPAGADAPLAPPKGSSCGAGGGGCGCGRA